MNSKEVRNVVASVLARLRNSSKSSGVPFQQVLQQYAMERFLYRVSKSQHAQSVILKGALLLKTIGIPNARPTMDIDMLRKGKADQASLVALVKDCETLKVEADGLTFPADTVVAEEITKDSEYKGTRILMDARMDSVRLRIQIDFGSLRSSWISRYSHCRHSEQSRVGKNSHSSGRPAADGQPHELPGGGGRHHHQVAARQARLGNPSAILTPCVGAYGIGGKSTGFTPGCEKWPHIRIKSVHENLICEKGVAFALRHLQRLLINHQRARRHLLDVEHGANLTGNFVPDVAALIESEGHFCAVSIIAGAYDLKENTKQLERISGADD